MPADRRADACPVQCPISRSAHFTWKARLVPTKVTVHSAARCQVVDKHISDLLMQCVLVKMEIAGSLGTCRQEPHAGCWRSIIKQLQLQSADLERCLASP